MCCGPGVRGRLSRRTCRRAARFGSIWICGSGTARSAAFVWEYLDLGEWDGTLSRIHHALYVEMREQAGREASPTTAIIDSQSAKGALKGGLRSTRPGMMRARRSQAASATS